MSDPRLDADEQVFAEVPPKSSGVSYMGLGLSICRGGVSNMLSESSDDM